MTKSHSCCDRADWARVAALCAFSIALVNGSILRQVEGGWATAIGCLTEAVVEGELALCLLLGSEVGEQLAVNVSKAKAAALGNRRQNLGITRSH